MIESVDNTSSLNDKEEKKTNSTSDQIQISQIE